VPARAFALLEKLDLAACPFGAMELLFGKKKRFGMVLQVAQKIANRYNIAVQPQKAELLCFSISAASAPKVFDANASKLDRTDIRLAHVKGRIADIADSRCVFGETRVMVKNIRTQAPFELFCYT
jgi:hypothetical protein